VYDNLYIFIGKAVPTKNRTIRAIIDTRKIIFARILAINLIMGPFEEDHIQLICLIFFLLQRTSVVSSSIEWQNGCAIQKQSRHDRT